MSSTPQWTPAQQGAIDTLDRQVLVAASAGTGKTAVLSERVARAVADPKGGVDIERILVLTFTEAAAEEMRSRIAARLRAEARRRKDRALRGQLLRMDAAHISTIHAFCKRILDAHFFEVGLDPCYSILDEDEKRLLRTDILRQVIDEAWNDPDLAGELPALFQDRSLRARGDDFLTTIVRMATFLEGVADAEQWLSRTEHPERLEETSRDLMLACLQECQERLRFAAHLDRTLVAGRYLSDQIVSDYIPQVEDLTTRLGHSDLSTWAAWLQEFQWSRAKPKPRDIDKETAAIIKQALDEAKETLNQLKKWSLCTPGSGNLLGPLAAEQGRTLVRLVRKYRVAFTAAKRQRNCLDFADLEHGLLRLLQDHPGIADRLSQSFDLIFVDEVQDVNAVQQAILDLIARDDNGFCVGDVKQSIYGFRQSRPEIFLYRLQQAGSTPGMDKRPLRVDLQENFRSRHELLAFTNTVFGRIMTESVAGMDYDDRAALVGGAAYEPLPEGTAVVEVAILDETEPDDGGSDNESTEEQRDEGTEELISAGQRQAAFIADRIERMVGQERFSVFDKGAQAYRPVRYGDIVILMRSLSGRAPQMVEILRLAGIPVSSQTTSGYFDAMEISDMLALMMVLDNPRRDVELAAVLRSALFDFSDSELAAIRMADPQGGKGRAFYESVLVAEQQVGNETLRQKLTDALQHLSQWRDLARRGSLAQLLWTVYRTTGYLAYVTALPNGAQRKANLLKLHDRAIQFEGFHEGVQLRSLSRFVEFVEKLLEEGGDWAPAEPDNSAENAVRIMSVHRSKGLEFPVVILAELNRGFNFMDSRGVCLLHEQYGLGLQVIEPQRRARFNSFNYEIIRTKQERQTLAEEMRILYVALTRARERLVLCASVKSDRCRDVVAQGALTSDGPIPGWMAAGAHCHFDWLLYGLAHSRPLQQRFLETVTADRSDKLYQLHCVNRDQLNQMTQGILHLRNTRSQARTLPEIKPAYAPAWVQQIEKALAWTYPHAQQTTTCAKQSVSELSHQGDEFAQLDVSRALTTKPRVAQMVEKTKTKVDSRELGTAMHLLFETLPLDTLPTQELIQTHIESLVAAERLRSDVLREAQIAAVLSFFNSPLGHACLDTDNKILREWPFTMRVATACSGDDFIVVQGIVDLIAITPQAHLIIDFKTDRIAAADVQERARLYENQLKLYAQAVRGILNAQDIKAHLYFLEPNVEVEIKIEL